MESPDFKSLLETTENTRELGGYKTSYGRETKKLSILRSDRQESPSQADISFLRDHKITTVIDLREEESVLEKPSGLKSVEGFDYHNCPIVEGSDIPESEDAVAPSYMLIAQSPSMTQVFKCIAHATDGVIFNCSAGKDRSGTLSAILLMHAGVSDEDIVSNYVATRYHLKKRFEKIREMDPTINMNIVIPQERYMREFLGLFREKFGTTDAYLESLGLSGDEIQAVRDKLVG